MTAVETAGSAEMVEVAEMAEDVQQEPVKEKEQTVGALDAVAAREVERNVQAAEAKQTLKAHNVMELQSAVKAAVAAIEVEISAEKVGEACHKKTAPKGSKGKMSSLKSTNGTGRSSGVPKRVRFSLAS